jgi:haloacetate dehalogenase
LGLKLFAPEALSEYERCIALDGSGRGITADYRASAGIDLEHDQADVDAGRKIQQPLQVLWGANGVVARCFDVMALWHERAAHATGYAVPTGHYVAEESPEHVLRAAESFFFSEKP